MLLQLSEATSAASKAADNVNKLASNDPLFGLLWFLVVVFGICLGAGVIYGIRNASSQAEKLQAACEKITAPMKESYEKVLLERNEKHAQEIRANETNHQAIITALMLRLESEVKDRQKLTEAAQNVYKEMADIVSPFTKSNELLAQRVQDVEHLLRASLTRTNDRFSA